MYKYVKNILRDRLSASSRASLRLPWRIIKAPFNTKRILNIFRYERSVVKKTHIDFVPPVFGIKIVGNCNLRCPNCLFLLENPVEFSNNYISVMDFQRVLDRYNEKREAEVAFLGGGEPLLHPDFEDLVNISREHDLKVKTSTNGILVKNKISAILKLDYINVSLDAYDYGSYKRSRGGTPQQFDIVLEGLRALKENNIYFSVSFLLSSDNISESDKMFKLAESIKPDSVIFHNINPHNSEIYKPLTVQDENSKNFLDKVLKRDDYPFDVYLPVIFDENSVFFHEAKCVQPWLYFLYDASGCVAYCCHLDNDITIGNVFENYNFNSEKMVKFRENIIRSKILKSCLYCQRRFMGKEYANFNSKMRKWS